MSHGYRGYGSPNKTFSIGLGCDISHAARLALFKGMDLRDPDVPTPIGAGCKVGEREACPQRAFPFVGRPLDVDENQSRFMPLRGSTVRQQRDRQERGQARTSVRSATPPLPLTSAR